MLVFIYTGELCEQHVFGSLSKQHNSPYRAAKPVWWRHSCTYTGRGVGSTRDTRESMRKGSWKSSHPPEYNNSPQIPRGSGFPPVLFLAQGGAPFLGAV